MRWLLLLLPFALLGCEAADQGYRDRTADRFSSDCTENPGSTTPKLKRELEQLCSCTDARIRSSDMRITDGNDVHNAKIQEAMAYCQSQVYPDEPQPAQ